MNFKVTPKRYSFTSTWHINTNTARAANIVIDHDNWAKWWDGLEKADVKNIQDGIVGSHINATWRALAGYKISLDIIITAYKPEQLVEFSSSGDLKGSGSWKIMPNNQSATKMVITWNVVTTKTWMNLLAPLLRPVFIYSHNHLMRDGEAGLNAYILKNETISQ